MNPYQIEPNGETVTSDRGERSQLWLVSWLQRRPDLLARVVTCYEQLKRRPAAWRRRLTRSAAVTLGGAALLLALSVAPVSGRNIKVANGEVEIRDNGKCSLIEAIRNANNTVHGQPHDDCAPGNPNGADTITLPEGGQFILKEAHNTGDYGANGLPWISSEITIEGNDSTIMRRDDAPAFRIVAVGPLGKLVARNVSLDGGAADPNSTYSGGGAMFNQGEVTLETCQVTGHTVIVGGEYRWVNQGGAIDNRAKLSISGSEFSDNRAYYGGAIESSGDLNIQDSSFVRNKSLSNYGACGGAIESSGDLTITDSYFRENWAFADYGGSGGAVRAYGNVTIRSTRFVDNEANSGGAVSFRLGTMRLSESEFIGNLAWESYGGSGGAISASGNTVIENSLISGNHAGGDQEYYPEFQRGGGISNWRDMTIIGSTISGNSALYGAGIFNRGVLTLKGTTVSGNRGDGILSTCLDWQSNPSGLWFERSLVSGNSGDQVTYTEDEGCDTLIRAGNHNLFGSLGDAGVNFELGPTDFVPDVGIDKILAPLADNGGPTWTHALVRRSPAIDAAPSADCEGMTDQRGYPRNVDGDGRPSSKECDVGAFEYGSKPPETPTPTATVTPRPSPTPTATPEPSATPTVEPSPTTTTTPTATPTVEPSATATSEPTQTPTVGPSPTTEPSPTATAWPELDWKTFVPVLLR